MSDFVWLQGPSAHAVRPASGRVWSVVPPQRSPHGEISIGLQIRLGKPDKEKLSDPASSKASFPAKLGIPLPGLPVLGAVLLVLEFIGAAVFGFVGGHASFPTAPASLLSGWEDLAKAGVAFALAYSVSVAVEAMLLSGSIQGNGRVFGVGLSGPSVESVAWRLGVPASLAVWSLLIPVSAVVLAFGWTRAAPAAAAGVAAGSGIYLLRALFPLDAGPGARLLEAVLKTNDIPRQLRWTLISRFLPVRPVLAVKGGWGMAIAALFLAAWAFFAGQTLSYLGQSAKGMTAAGLIWKSLASVGGFGFTLWLVLQIVLLFRSGLQLKGANAIKPAEPPAEAIEAWQSSSALLRHLPQLKNLPWKWAEAPAGALLIAYKATERVFYWLASGATQVIARSPDGDPLHVATLQAGSGIGEIAFLEDKPRTADVVIVDAALVAYIDYESFQKIASDKIVDVFRDVVHASQSLSRSNVFAGIPPADRERWIASGVRETFVRGQAIIEEGTQEKWIGMIVRGKVAVERGGKVLAELGPDAVFGEMAYLAGAPRNATLRAMEPVVVWRWNETWLDGEMERTGIRTALEQLAKERT